MVTGGLGLIMAGLASVYLRQRVPVDGVYSVTIPGLLIVVAAAIMVSLAIVSVITDPARAPAEYAPEVEVDEPTREAEPADVAEQLIEVPVPEDEESDAAEPAEY